MELFSIRIQRTFQLVSTPLMNMVMNRNILTFLNEYAEIPDPQYAIMLRGAWGCGKTFFIQTSSAPQEVQVRLLRSPVSISPQTGPLEAAFSAASAALSA